jgi:hypothetical protein
VLWGLRSSPHGSLHTLANGLKAVKILRVAHGKSGDFPLACWMARSGGHGSSRFVEVKRRQGLTSGDGAQATVATWRSATCTGVAPGVREIIGHTHGAH